MVVFSEPGEDMHLIKKYANRKLYDTTDKCYLTMDRLAELIKEGAEVEIVDNETGKDLTASILTQLLARERLDSESAVPPGILMQMLRKGRGTLFGYGKKYVSLWQNALMMSKDEIEKFINSLVKDRELSEAEGKNLKKEIVTVTSQLKAWIMQNVDRRVSEALKMTNLATHEQIVELTKKVDALSRQVKDLEKR
jgi:polyhydroxyalkanoate synthesis repressor PhaR